MSDTPYPKALPCPSTPDSLRLQLTDDTTLRFDPGDTVRVATYDDRIYRYVQWSADRRVLFRAVGWGSPVPTFTVGADRVAADVAAGELTPVECDWRTVLRDTVACLRTREWVALAPPEKGDVPVWQQTTRTRDTPTESEDGSGSDRERPEF